MLRKVNSTLLPFLVVGLLLTPALSTLLRADSLPCTHDNLFHAFRIVAVRDLHRHGWLFSRWLPNLALGYGYPFFNYREVLPYFAGEALFALGIPLPLALGLLYAFSWLAGAWGALVLAKDLFGPVAGYVTGAAYALGPYFFLDVLRRGNLPEVVGLALIPWLLVVARRLILHGGRTCFLVMLALLVVLFLSHSISSLLLAPFLGAYVVVLAVLYRDRGFWPYAFLAVGIAVLMTAWFTLPALLERDWVQLHLSRTTRNNDFHYNFVSWREMLLTVPVDLGPDYLNPPMMVFLGLAQFMLALIGLGSELLDRSPLPNRVLTSLFALTAGGYLWLASPGSLKLWETVPLMAFVQFPWRLVGRALLPVSLLAGRGVAYGLDVIARGLPGRRFSVSSRQLWAWFDTAVIILCLGLLALPMSRPPKGWCPMERVPDMRDLYALEEAGWIGMDPENSYFPIWVEQHPSDTRLADAFVQGRLPRRFDPQSLPLGGKVSMAVYRALSAIMYVETPSAFEARWLGLYFPGWEVRVDGDKVPIMPEDDTGLMLFPVPAGKHWVEVRLGLTPARRLGVGLSLFGGLVMVISLWRGVPFRPREPGTAQAHSLGWVAAAFLLIGAILPAAVWFGRGGHLPTPDLTKAMTAGYLPDDMVPLGQAFAGGLVLEGYSVAQETVAADDELFVSLLWLVADSPETEVRTTVLLRGPDGQSWSLAGTARPRGYESPPPSTQWQAGQFFYDPHLVLPIAGTPPGEYEIVVSVFDVDTLAPLSVLGPDGQPVGPDLVLGRVTITRPNSPFTPASLGLASERADRRCDGLALWSITFDRQEAAPGELLTVRWIWEATRLPIDVESVTLALRDGQDDIVHTWTLSPVGVWWPPREWRAGELWLGRPTLRLPGGLESGYYVFEVEVAGCSTPLARVPVEVVAPTRNWMVPSGMKTVGVSFGDVIELAAYRVSEVAPGSPLEIELAWRGLREMETSYRVYVHLLDESGQLVDQSDGEPLDWHRPTTGWAEGEVVVENRHVMVPERAGRYIIRVGLYDPSGPRLLTTDGDDGYVLGTFDVLDAD